MAKIDLLKQEGHELRRPAVDYLRDDIYELRVVHSGNQYRILFFYDGNIAVVLCHAFIKKTNKVPQGAIDRALARRTKYLEDKKKHTYEVSE